MMPRYLILSIIVSICTSTWAQQNDHHTLFMERLQADVELGYAIGAEYDYRTDFIKLNFNCRYTFNPFITVGLGSGIRFYHDERDFVIPIYASFQSNLPRNKATPFFALSIGYLFDITTKYEIYDVAPMFNPSVGVSFNLSEKTAITIGIGYEMQRARMFDDWLGPSYPEYLSFVSLNASFIFRNLGFVIGGKESRK